MDFLVIYSNYSNACGELFQLYPNLRDSKGVCADNKDLRELIINDLKIAAVPALIVIDDKNILQRIIGIDRIKTWLWSISNEVDNATSRTNQETFDQDIPEITDISNQSQFVDDILPPEQNEILPEANPRMLKPPSGSVKSLAEEMQREREQLMKNVDK